MKKSVEHSEVEELLSLGFPLVIVSGEGEIGTVEVYHGKRSVRAILCRLAKERCHGDRWAKCDVRHDDKHAVEGREGSR